MDTLIELMKLADREHGPRTALVIKPGFRTRTWTYGDVTDQVPRVARLLRDEGVAPGDRVLVWAVNRPEWAIAFLGALWAEAVAVPVDVRTAEEFATKVAAQTRPKLVLASMPTLAAAQSLELPTITVESLVDRARSAEPLPEPSIGPDTLAEVVFTSGTTGDPKGVMLTHRNIASNATALESVVPLGPETRLLSILPLSHMYGLNPGMLAPMLAGASVVYPTSLQPPVLARTFREQRVTMLLAVPQVVKLLTNAIERKVDAGGKRAMFERLHRVAPHMPMGVRRLLFGSVLSRFGGRLRYLAVGAAAMNPNIARRWEHMGVVSLQGYGATETSPVIAFTRIERNRIGTVGEVLPGVEVRIAPDGEVLVRGPNVFAGYWERPDATAAVLDADGWYHTGDHGILDSDGFLTLQGRKKEMLVMSDGTKVHPTDIEKVLISDPAVRDAAVIGLEKPGGDVQVHAALILREEADAAAVVERANARLGGHQQIRGHTIWPDDDFPRTATTKVKKADVQRWIEAGQADAPPPPSVSATALAAATGVERLVRHLDGVPAELVRTDARLSSDLGIDSLGRVELLSLIEEELGAYIDDGELDPDETVGGLQAQVDAAAGTASAEEGVYSWPLNPLLGALRIGIQEGIVRPLAALLYRRQVRGREHLDGLEGPALFAANHHLHNDNALILLSIPLRWRWRLSVAAALDGVFNSRWRGFMATIIGNAFPLARTGAVRRSLDRLGARLDRDYSVLIYPEGELTVGGPLQELKTGTGLVAVHGAVPVIPVRLNVRRHSRWDKGTAGRAWRGDVEVAFGAPLRFGVDVDPVDATERIREAIEALATVHAPAPTAGFPPGEPIGQSSG